MRVLVTGGARSGKSTWAESLVAGWARTVVVKDAGAAPDRVVGRPTRPVIVEGSGATGEPGEEFGATETAPPDGEPVGAVDYVATGYPSSADDPDWAERVRLHRERRPSSWRTLETLDVAGVLRGDGPPVLVDCAGLWLTRLADETGAWSGEGDAEIERRVAELLDALSRTVRDVVVVTNEVGGGLVPTEAGSRWYRDALGRLNARMAAVCDEVWLCVCGIPVAVKRG